MTAIVGIKYEGGIVMASDLLGRKGNERIEHKKIYHNSRLAIGLGGRSLILGGADVFSGLVRNSIINSGEDTRDLGVLLVRLNKTMQALDISHSGCTAYSLIASYDNGNFDLAYSDGKSAVLEHHRQFVMAPPEDLFSIDFPGIDGYDKALAIALEAVKQYNRYHSDSCSGLHAVSLTKEGAREVAYDKPVL